MKLRIAALAGIGLLGASAFAGVGLAGPEFRNKYASTEAARDCGDGDSVVYNGPLKMWPPNHKLQDVSVTATDGPSQTPGDAASNGTALSVAPTVTDVAGGDGGPNHDPDYTPGDLAATGDPSATIDFFLRSERSGKGEGRTYTIDWVASFDGGSKECTSADEGQTPFVVTVPHDMRGGADWK